MENDKYYITEHLPYLTDIQKDDIIFFEMPSFCSGEYSARVYKDDYGFYILSKNNFFKGCRDYVLNKPMWSETTDLTKLD